MDKEFLDIMVPESMKQLGMGQTPADYYDMGSRFMTAGVNNNEADALSISMYCFEVAAELGHAGAQGSLASGLMSGMGVEKDFKKAEYWAEKSANQGDSGGMLGLGVCCFHRDDYTKAEYWLTKSMNAGHPEAKTMLEQILEMKRILNK